MKNKKQTKYIVIALVVIVVLYLGYRYWKNAQSNSIEKAINNASTSSTNSTTTGNSTTSQACTNSTVLKRGMSKCDRIQWSQYYINKVASKLGISKLAEDAIFGAKTETAFQKLLGKKTGTWTEVKAKVDSMNSGTNTTAVVGSDVVFIDGIKW